jgi:hypothetical protein
MEINYEAILTTKRINKMSVLASGEQTVTRRSNSEWQVTKDHDKMLSRVGHVPSTGLELGLVEIKTLVYIMTFLSRFHG